MGRRKFGGKKQGNLILCNNCGSPLKMKIYEKVIDYDADGKEIREQYLMCGHCRQRFTVSILDEYMRTKIAERKVTRDYMKNQILKKEMEERQAVLKQKYGRT